jgi:hypothetical protein
MAPKGWISLAIGSLLVAACGGDGDGDGDESSTANDDFCEGFARLNEVPFHEVGLDPDAPEYREMIEGMRALDPPDEIADDWAIALGLVETLSPASAEGPEREAVDHVETFLGDECGIDMSGERDPAAISYDCSTGAPSDGEPVTTTQGADLPVRLVESGFCTYGSETRYGLVIQNTTDETLTGVQIVVDALDGSGTKVNPLSIPRHIDVLLPGEELGVGGFFLYESPPEVARLDVHIDGPDEGRDPPPTGELAVSDVSTTLRGTERTTTFTVTSSYDQRLEDLPVSIIYRNADGDIVGGYYSHLDVVESGNPTTSDVNDIGYPNPAVTQAQVFVEPDV